MLRTRELRIFVNDAKALYSTVYMYYSVKGCCSIVGRSFTSYTVQVDQEGVDNLSTDMTALE